VLTYKCRCAPASVGWEGCFKCDTSVGSWFKLVGQGTRESGLGSRESGLGTWEVVGYSWA